MKLQSRPTPVTTPALSGYVFNLPLDANLMTLTVDGVPIQQNTGALNFPLRRDSQGNYILTITENKVTP